ncbi:alpha-N-acetylglucosaminidase [Pedobacter sp. B4-66]|uniref:alpha-N-acetylglucosaminidase n=1 Tax=Pedobacter sp. B4-66 TaxID=2817280 RepID=UPI00202491A9|nr:alpha-N-acetylglucosaminidase [Pedobacter sp. B4-66]
MKKKPVMCRTIAMLLFCLTFAVQTAGAKENDSASLNEEAAYALIKRILPKYADRFLVAYIPMENNKDVFELESKGEKIILKGNNGVSVASALNYWLKNYAHCDISWNGTNLEIPKPFPMVKEKVHKVTPHDYRHYFNYCTFNYTASWWDWGRWQWEIDFMALNGINMPLSMTGQNALWDRVYRSLGFDDADMDAFFTGPAYFMWFWAGNIDGLNGPLPKSWMKSHEELQKKILLRERELGMKPILPAFSGHVPPTFKKRFPNAKVDKVNWEGRFADAYVLDPEDPMFQQIADKFMQEQKNTFGLENHLYGADTFNEMDLPHQDSAYVRKIGKAVYDGMVKTDPNAIWVMQGWLFWDRRDFWKPERINNYLSGVPDDKLIILDLFADEQPIWTKTKSFFGKPWIWCMLHNFGGRNPLYGNLDYIAKEPAEMVYDPNKGQLSGIGLVPEGIEQNPVVYSLMLNHVWNDKPVNVGDWLIGYAHSRYGKRNQYTEKAWNILHKTVYAKEGSYETIVVARPTFEKDNEWAATDLPYDAAALIPAWQNMLAAADQFKNNDCYQFDLVSVGTQVLANYASVVQQKFAKDFKQKNSAAFKQHTTEFMQLIADMDQLMGTRRELLLGKWLNDAKKWGTNTAETRLYEKNARDLITLWGGKDAVLHEYANKQWSGLFNGFYGKRWKMFITEASDALKSKKTFDQKVFTEKIKNWEWDWVNGTELYPDQPSGDAAAISKMMYAKYNKQIIAAYKELKLTKNKK